MKTQPAKNRPGKGTSPHPLWMSLLTVFCMALLGVVGTAQVCHSHDEAPNLNYRLSATDHTSVRSAQPAGAPTTSTVSCPLCVAMHSALPATHHLTQIALLRSDPPAPAPQSIARRLLWHSDRTCRPPPATAPLA